MKKNVFIIFLLIFLSIISTILIVKKNETFLNIPIFQPIYNTVSFNIDSDKESDSNILLSINNKYFRMNRQHKILKLDIKNEKIRDAAILVRKNTDPRIKNIFIFNDLKFIKYSAYSSWESSDVQVCSQNHTECDKYISYKFPKSIYYTPKSKYINLSGNYNYACTLFLALIYYFSYFLIPFCLLFLAIIIYSKNKKNFTLIKNINVIPYLFFVFLLIAFLLRLNGLIKEPLWYDEIFTIYKFGSPYSPLSMAFIDKGNPPLFFILLKFWTTIFGQSLCAIKALPLLLGLGAIIGLYAFLKKYFDEKTALVGMGLSTINLYYIFYSQEVRSYSLMMLLCPIIILYLFQLLEKDKSRYYILYAIFTGLVLNSHYYGLLFTFANFVYGTYYLLGHKMRTKYVKFVVSNILAFITFIVYFITAGHYALSDPLYNSWIPPLSYNLIKTIIAGFFGNLAIFSLLIIVLSFLYAQKNLVSKKIQNKYFFQTLTYCIVIIGIVFAETIVFSTSRSIILFRCYMSIYPVYMILISILISEGLKSKYKYVAIIFSILFIQSFNSKNILIERKANWSYLDAIMNVAYYDAPQYLKEAKNVYVISGDDNSIFPPSSNGHFKKLPGVEYLNDKNFKDKIKLILNTKNNFVLYTDVKLKEYQNYENIELYNPSSKIDCYRVIKGKTI